MQLDMVPEHNDRDQRTMSEDHTKLRVNARGSEMKKGEIHDRAPRSDRRGSQGYLPDTYVLHVEASRQACKVPADQEHTIRHF